MKFEHSWPPCRCISNYIGTYLLAFIVFFLMRSRKENTEASNVGLGLFFVSLFYVSFSIIRFVHLEVGPLDNRMMSGIYIPLVLVFGTGLDAALQNNSSKKIVSAIFAVLLFAIGSQSVLSSFEYGANGRYWGSDIHQEQPLHEFVKSLDTKSQFMSNEPQMLFSVIEQSPIFNQYMNSRIFPKPCTDRYIIWYANSYLPDAKPFGGKVIYADAVGEVIQLANCKIPALTFWP